MYGQTPQACIDACGRDSTCAGLQYHSSQRYQCYKLTTSHLANRVPSSGSMSMDDAMGMPTSMWSLYVKTMSVAGSPPGYQPPPPPRPPPRPKPPPPPSPPPVGCRDDPTYFDVWNCAAWANQACRNGYPPVNTAARISLLVSSCPETCTDVTPGICSPPPPWIASPPPPSPKPPPPYTATRSPPPAGGGSSGGRCTDDPYYVDTWNCGAWRTYGPGCRVGYPPVNTAERIARLVESCPESCNDVTPNCGGSGASSPPPPTQYYLSPPPPSPSPPASQGIPPPSYYVSSPAPPSPSPPSSSSGEPETGCKDNVYYFDTWSCTAWRGYAAGCRTGYPPVNTAARLTELVKNCPESCQDVTPICGASPPPAAVLRSPPPPPPPPAGGGSGARCTDDPTYVDNGWRCSAWRTWSGGCRGGYPPVSTAERTQRLVESCPESCQDVTPTCGAAVADGIAQDDAWNAGGKTGGDPSDFLVGKSSGKGGGDADSSAGAPGAGNVIEGSASEEGTGSHLLYIGIGAGGAALCIALSLVAYLKCRRSPGMEGKPQSRSPSLYKARSQTSPQIVPQTSLGPAGGLENEDSREPSPSSPERPQDAQVELGEVSVARSGSSGSFGSTEYSLNERSTAEMLQKRSATGGMASSQAPMQRSGSILKQSKPADPSIPPPNSSMPEPLARTPPKNKAMASLGGAPAMIKNISRELSRELSGDQKFYKNLRDDHDSEIFPGTPPRAPRVQLHEVSFSERRVSDSI